MVLASRTGSGADARMVVLRQVDADPKIRLVPYRCSGRKVMQLEAFPNATLLFWDDTLQAQLRLTVETHLHTNDYIADEHWQEVSVSAVARITFLNTNPAANNPAPTPAFRPTWAQTCQRRRKVKPDAKISP